MKTIILIDDDVAIQDALKVLLWYDGFKVEGHSHAAFIFRQEFSIPFLFLIDRRLIGIDGLDVCRFLKSNHTTANVPVIMFSASPSVERMAYSAGADYFIEKPFSTGLLRKTLKKIAQPA